MSVTVLAPGDTTEAGCLMSMILQGPGDTSVCNTKLYETVTVLAPGDTTDAEVPR